MLQVPQLSGKNDREDYVKLSKFASQWDHSVFLNQTKEKFGWLYDKKDMDYIALH